MFEIVRGTPQESVRKRQREALLLIDQLERAQLYLTSALYLETGDESISREVDSIHRDLAHLIQDVRSLRVL